MPRTSEIRRCVYLVNQGRLVLWMLLSFVLCLYTAANDGKVTCATCYRSRSASRGDGMLEKKRFGV